MIDLQQELARALTSPEVVAQLKQLSGAGRRRCLLSLVIAIRALEKHIAVRMRYRFNGSYCGAKLSHFRRTSWYDVKERLRLVCARWRRPGHRICEGEA